MRKLTNGRPARLPPIRFLQVRDARLIHPHFAGGAAASNPTAQYNKAEHGHLRRVREVMLQNTHSAGQTVMAAERIVPIDRARSFITLLVVLHHSVINYTYFSNADRMRWLGFDLVVLFNDSFFMACMFFIFWIVRS